VIEQIGAPLDLYDRPANTFVASFIGSPSMNFLNGVVQGDQVALGDTFVPLPPSSPVREGQKIIYGVRPEHMMLGEAGLPATVAVVEPTGAETHVMSRYAGQDIVAVFRDRHDLRPDQLIHLSPDPDKAHLFDAETKQRLTQDAP